MNPLEWLKLAYGVFGAKHPTASLVAVIVLCGLFGAAVWKLGAHLWEKDQAKILAPSGQGQSMPSATGSATTHGDSSPANTGTIGTLNVGTPTVPKKTEQ